ncbi:MAG: cryptochrome/photolyase family protein [Jatrophihabitantaceae bacterium]
MAVVIALFTRDLRVHDNPMLAAASRGNLVVPLFVADRRIDELGFAGHHRGAFLADCLADLDGALRARGGRLVVRRGELRHEVVRLAEQVDAAAVHVSADVSRFATGREHALRSALAEQGRDLVVQDGVHAVHAAGALVPAGSDHFAVFTPYWRRWSDRPLRDLAPVPRRISMPDGVAETPLPSRDDRHALPRGGEVAGRQRAARWLSHGLADYADRHDLLAVDGTSRLSPYLHFGCISAVELVARVRARGGPGAGADAFVRQLAWRDFHAQVLAARPDAAWADYRDRNRAWRDDPELLHAWQAGQTGYPVVDAGMRQLVAEGWMHNRARLITGSFLTKTLGLDWRAGAAHFFTHLLDGDLANNCLNWQWVAGTGTDTRPYRRLNPIRQAHRFDPDGDYVRRWVPELADLPATVIHEPWRLPEPSRQALRYPDPVAASPPTR